MSNAEFMLTTNVQPVQFQAARERWELNVLRELRSLEPERSSDVRSDAGRFPGGGMHVIDNIFMKEALIKVSEC